MGRSKIKIANIKFQISNFALDLVFPRFCIGCDREGIDFCQDCLHNLRPRAMVRREGFDDLDGVLTLAPYGDPVVRNLIHAWKYDKVKALEQPLTVFVRRSLVNTSVFQDIDLVIPIPLHWFRERERGFNQAAAIAHAVGETLGRPVAEKMLTRVRRTKPQSKLQHGSLDRAKNVDSAFRLEDHTRVLRKQCLLVDDVVTSGMTVDACARVLKQAGAKSVWGFAIARG